LKKKVKDALEKEAQNLSEDKTKAELLKKLIQKTPFELPRTMIDSEINRLLQEVASAYRIDLKKLQQNESQIAEYRKNLEPRAVNNLKQELLLAEIAKHENLKITDKEIDKEIESSAKKMKKDFASVKNSMIENKTISTLKYRLRLNKALDFLYKNANLDKVKKLKYDEATEGGN